MLNIETIKSGIDSEIAAIDSIEALESVRTKYLGRKGVLSELTGSIPSLPKEQRAAFGQAVNGLKTKINQLLEDKQKTFSGAIVESREPVDIGMPGIAQDLGQLHPITQT